MKTPIALALALLCAVLASAADITLKDGRVLMNAVVLKQDASTVTVRHSGGFTQVEKPKLPDELLAQYPLDAEAAARDRVRAVKEAAEREAARAHAYAQRKIEAERIASLAWKAKVEPPQAPVFTKKVWRTWTTADGVTHYAYEDRRVDKFGRVIWGPKGKP